MPAPVQIIEALLLASEKPLSIDRLVSLLSEQGHSAEFAAVDKQVVRDAITMIQMRYQNGVLQLKEVASGYRLQIDAEYAVWIGMLHEERPQRYSRALLETLAIIAYRQPITRGDIEDIRGVAVSTHIIKTLQEREWVRIVGHKDVPGKPALYATTRQFLNYFNLSSLEQLPPLAEVRDLAEIADALDFGYQEEIAGERSMSSLAVEPKASDSAEAGQQSHNGPDATFH
jgi:segregation and condensation protein B